jgi:hypothetical protein
MTGGYFPTRYTFLNADPAEIEDAALRGIWKQKVNK